MAILKQRVGCSFPQDSFILGILSGIQSGHCLLSDDTFGFKVSLELFFFFSFLERWCQAGFSVKTEVPRVYYLIGGLMRLVNT